MGGLSGHRYTVDLLTLNGESIRIGTATDGARAARSTGGPGFALGELKQHGFYWNGEKLERELRRIIGIPADTGDTPNEYDLTTAEGRNLAGIAHARKGDYDSAFAEFTAAIELDTAFAKAYYNRAGALEELGRVKEAFRDYRRFIDLCDDPKLARQGWQELDRFSGLR